MIGPADRFLKHVADSDILSNDARELRSQEVSRPSIDRRHGRRAVLGLIAGVAAAAVLGQRSAFAEDAESVADTSAVPAAENPDEQPADGAPEPTASSPAVTPKTYTVQASDTMYSIAKRHGVSVDAILWANDLTDPNVLKQGQQLVIPPSSGKLHTVKDGDTLDSLSEKYSVSKTGIVTVNGLAEDASLRTGQRLLIPVKSNGGDPAFTPAPLAAASSEDAVPIPQNAGTGSPTPPVISTIAPLIQVPGVMTGTGAPSVTITNRKIPKLAWPIAVNPPKSGVSQGFRPGHTGIDIFSPEGTPIRAAAGGTVKMAEKNPDGFSGYGWIVILDHGDGISTWYAHCGDFSVKTGDKVKAGDKIGEVGMTGRTTGPHLHFELRISASAVDPRLALA
ncbi:MAG: peptidoglycan DD-metalloendopeptidase family protein [Chloroflexota bacterium]